MVTAVSQDMEGIKASVSMSTSGTGSWQDTANAEDGALRM